MEFVPLMFNRLCLTLIHKTKQNGLKRVILRVMEAQDVVLDSDPAEHHQRLCMSLNGILITMFQML